MKAVRTALAMVAVTATALVCTATAAPAAAPKPLAYTSKTLCLDNGLTRVRIKIENPAGREQETFYSVDYQPGSQRDYSHVVEPKAKELLVGFTIPADGSVDFTAGDNRDTFSGQYDRTFTPRHC